MPDYDSAVVTPLDKVEDLEQYRLYGKPEIAQVLKSLSKRPEIVTAYLDEDDLSGLLTAVVDVVPKAGYFILDQGPDATLNRAALNTRRLICVAKQGSVDVRFECGPLQAVEYDGHPAFKAPLPDWVLRLQRREYFRVATLLTSPVSCEVDAGPDGVLTYSVADLSLGGIGMVDSEQKIELSPGQVLAGCQLVLPEFGAFKVDLEVRSVFPYTLRNGDVGRRIGLAFVGLSNDKQSLVQRYLHHLQLRLRER